MAWNTGHAKYRSTELTALDCGNALKIQRQETNYRLYATFTTPSTGMERGTCCAMVRLFAGTRVMGAKLDWVGANTGTIGGGLNTTAVFLGLGDPFACGRFLGPVLAAPAASGTDNTCAAFWGLCGIMHKVGPAGSGGRGDACGIGYTYTCDVDLILTNLWGATSASQGGWQGSDATSGVASTTATGTITLTLDILPPG